MTVASLKPGDFYVDAGNQLHIKGGAYSFILEPEGIENTRSEFVDKVTPVNVQIIIVD